MLSYGAFPENTTGHNFFEFHPRHTLICTCFDTPFGVQTAKREQRLQRKVLPLATAVNPKLTVLATVATTPVSTCLHARHESPV